MRFIVDVEVKPDDDGDETPITEEQMRNWLEEYALSSDVSFEMSLVPGDPFLDGDGPFRTFVVTSVKVEVT